jgi:hypothetical protein
MNKKVIVLLVIVIALLAFIAFKPKEKAATVFPTANPNNQRASIIPSIENNNNSPAAKQPSSKDTYQGYGFTVDYPTSKTYEDVGTYMAAWGARAVIFLNGDVNDNTQDVRANYIVYIADNIADNQALDIYTKKFIKGTNGNENFSIDEKTVTVAGRTGIQYSYKAIAGGYDGIVYVTAVIHDKKAYIIQFIDGTTSDYMKFVSNFNFQ